MTDTDHLRSPTPVVVEARVVAGSGGGPDKTILNTPRFLDPLGYRTFCAYLHPPADPGFDQLRRKAERWGAPLHSVPDRGPLDWRVVRECLRLCRHERVAIWHGHDYKTNLLGLVLARFWPMRLVTTVHGWVEFTPRTLAYFTLDRLCLRFYERVFCVSPDLHERALGCGVRQDQALLLENGIDTTEFARRQTMAEARQPLGLSADAFVIGAVGRLSPEKGFDLLIRALAQLRGEGLDARLVILGEGSQRAELEALAAELSCAGAVHWMGFQTDPRPFYEAMTVYALSSLREGLPNVVLEAMALEVPVVATRIAGVPRVLTDGQNGLLVEPGSVGELTAALRRLAADAELRQCLGRAGRQTIEERYSFQRRMEKVAAVFDELLGRRPLASSSPVE